MHRPQSEIPAGGVHTPNFLSDQGEIVEETRMAEQLNRRGFIQAAAGSAAVALSPRSYGRVLGANDRIGVGFIGVGGRCQAHIKVITDFQATKKTVAPVAVCDVWDGLEAKYEFRGQERLYSQGLYPSAKKCGLDPHDKKHVVKDYREVLDLREVDVVCICTPDHWHARMCLDAAKAGKDIYCEKPLTRTIAEAHAVVDAVKKHNRVMTVGVQSMAEPTWLRAYEFIKKGGIGHVAQGQTSYYRNDIRGQWRGYRLWKEMNPKTIDWDMFLGHAFEVDGVPLAPKIDFDRAVFGQWRCYWPFGGGMFTDLFVHQTTHMLAAMGLRYPARVVGAGGLYLEYDGRDVPDVATVVADYDEGCQLIITATMISSYPIEEVIRGRLGVIKFVKGGFEVIQDDPSKGVGLPPRLEDRVKGEFVECNPARDHTPELWADFLECVRSRNRETASTPELGAAAFTTVALGVQSYRQGVVLHWDRERRQSKSGDETWAARWQKRSQQRGAPNNIQGWQGGDKGCSLEPPDYMDLAGPWMDGKDPADKR